MFSLRKSRMQSVPFFWIGRELDVVRQQARTSVRQRCSASPGPASGLLDHSHFLEHATFNIDDEFDVAIHLRSLAQGIGAAERDYTNSSNVSPETRAYNRQLVKRLRKERTADTRENRARRDMSTFCICLFKRDGSTGVNLARSAKWRNSEPSRILYRFGVTGPGNFSTQEILLCQLAGTGGLLDVGDRVVEVALVGVARINSKPAGKAKREAMPW